jgi:hypothetical protein
VLRRATLTVKEAFVLQERGWQVERCSCRAITVDKVGMETVTIELSFDKDFAETTTGDLRVRVIPGGITVLPPIITVFLAITTQDVLVSLFCGVWSAAFFIHSCAAFREDAACCLVALHACVAQSCLVHAASGGIQQRPCQTA